MSDDHIGVKVNGVLYVKLEDARKLREGWDEADERIEAQAAEIARLRAELATARREGMEHVLTRLLWHQHNRCSGWRQLRAFDQALEIIRKEIDAIRAAAKEVKP